MFITGRKFYTHLSFPLCQTTKIPPCWSFLIYVIYGVCVWERERERGCLALYSKPVSSSFLNHFLGIEILLKPSIIEKWNRLLKDWMMHFKSNRHVNYLLFQFVHPAVPSMITVSSIFAWELEIRCKIQIIHTNQVKRNEDFFLIWLLIYFLGGKSIIKIIQNRNSNVFLLNCFRPVAGGSKILWKILLINNTGLSYYWISLLFNVKIYVIYDTL